MAIHVQEAGQETIITLQTAHTTYQMKVDEFGVLLHTYYGGSVENSDMSYLIRRLDRSFSPAPAELGRDHAYSLDYMPQEYPGADTGDFRETAIQIQIPDYTGLKLQFQRLQVSKGKYGLPGLPAVYADQEEAETLRIWLEDEAAGISVCLLYGVLPGLDVITRACEITNDRRDCVVLTKAMSVSMDLPGDDLDLLTFHGRHAMERQLERAPITHGGRFIGSRRGYSSHQQNPFVMVASPDTTENQGWCMGMSLVYSGNFLAVAERSQFDDVRLTMGILPEDFVWQLEPGEAFSAPEVVLSCSEKGFNQLSQNYHKTYRKHLCRGVYRDAVRPVLINNWEATYFDFDGDKIVEIARQAAELGVDLMVLDDGWFGHRDKDDSSLGDWFVNEEKIKGTMGQLADRVNRLGMKFGLWFEPEMISEESELYREHPDWVLQVPGREPARGRYQLVLDFSRDDVRDYLYQRICAVLDGAHIEYVKWDANRHLTDVYSENPLCRSQGEVRHRYILGLYDLLERLTSRYPNVLWEGCSGGGGRFDPGMLYYHPQIWCSDDTDAIARLRIQYGTSYGYPISAIGAHVSAVPNHQTGRVTPIETRAITAMAGTFGYELDLNRLSEEEKELVRGQIADFKKYYHLIQNGNYYRLSGISDAYRYICWAFVSEDGEEALVQGVRPLAEANGPCQVVRLAGLTESARYRVEVLRSSSPEAAKFYEKRRSINGAALMKAGLPLPELTGDAQSVQIYLRRER